MNQRVLMIVFIVAVVLGGGYYAFQQLVSPPAEEAAGPVYATSPVVRGDISVGVEATGPLNPAQEGGIMVPGGFMPSGPPPSYVVQEVLAKEGDEVRAGQLLVKLSGSEMETQIETKEKKLRTDRKTLATLLGVPPDQVEGVEPGRGLTLRAPIDGRVVGLGVKEGQDLKQGQIVARVVDDSRFRLTARLTPGEIGRVGLGQRLFLRFDQFDNLVEVRAIEINPDPVPMAGSDLADSLPAFRSGDQPVYQFVYQVTLEGTNTGLIRPDMLAQVGAPAGDNVWFFRYYAKVEGYANEEQVLSGTDAIATRVHVHEMKRVRAGDALISLAGADARQMIEEKQGDIRELELELQQLRVRLNDLDVRAPIDGIVARIEARPGTTVHAGQWFGHIFNTSDMQMWVEVDDVDVLMVRQGVPVRVTVDALPGKTFDGKVEFVGTMGKDEKGITRYQVTIRVKGGPDLRPGMQAKAQIDAGSAKGVLLIPVEAVFEEDGQPRVEVLLPNGTAKVVPVELGLMNDRVAEVKSGLKEGELVITGSTADLLPSQRIKSNNLLPGGREGTDGQNSAGDNTGSGNTGNSGNAGEGGNAGGKTGGR